MPKALQHLRRGHVSFSLLLNGELGQLALLVAANVIVATIAWYVVEFFL
jgi:hypothetical protein